MEKITLENLAPYLPYGLKYYPSETSDLYHDLYAENNDDFALRLKNSYLIPNEPFIAIEDGELFLGQFKSSLGFDVDDVYASEVIPILRPMSDLIKEIDGIIPFEEIARVEAPNIVGASGKLTKITPFTRRLSFNSNQIGVRYTYEGVQVVITHYRNAVFHKKAVVGDHSWIYSYFHDYSGIIKILNKYHFDYNCLIEKGLAISIHDLKI